MSCTITPPSNVLREHRMTCKSPKASARILLGLQMLVTGVVSLYFGYEPVMAGSWVGSDKSHWWGSFMVLSGLGLMIPCLLEMFFFEKMGHNGPTYRPPMTATFIVRSRTLGFAFAGCIWSALWYIGLFDGQLRSLDFLGAIYVGFVIWLRVFDSKVQRSVHTGAEKRGPFVFFY